jgi:hypothetical protein
MPSYRPGRGSGLLTAVPSTPDNGQGMVYFFVRGPETKFCEVRLNPDGEGYELVVREHDGVEHIERFKVLDEMLRREHELTQAWRATGWRLTGGRQGRKTKDEG